MSSARTSFYSGDELLELGFAEIGRDVRISRKCSLYGTAQMRIGNNVRIDDFSILSGEIMLGSHIHIAAYCGLFGGAGITMRDFAALSSRVAIYSVSDDFSGESLSNPTIPEAFRKLDAALVEIGRHSIIGSGTVIMPGSQIEEGVSVGALSLVRGTLESWGIYAGVPARRAWSRSRALLEQEPAFLAWYAAQDTST